MPVKRSSVGGHTGGGEYERRGPVSLGKDGEIPGLHQKRSSQDFFSGFNDILTYL